MGMKWRKTKLEQKRNFSFSLLLFRGRVHTQNTFIAFIVSINFWYFIFEGKLLALFILQYFQFISFFPPHAFQYTSGILISRNKILIVRTEQKENNKKTESKCVIDWCESHKLSWGIKLIFVLNESENWKCDEKENDEFDGKFVWEKIAQIDENKVKNFIWNCRQFEVWIFRIVRVSICSSLDVTIPGFENLSKNLSQILRVLQKKEFSWDVSVFDKKYLINHF